MTISDYCFKSFSKVCFSFSKKKKIIKNWKNKENSNLSDVIYVKITCSLENSEFLEYCPMDNKKKKKLKNLKSHMLDGVM